MKQDEPVFTAKEVAKKLRVSHATVIRLIETGQLQALRVGNQFRIPQSSFDEYIRKASQS